MKISKKDRSILYKEIDSIPPNGEWWKNSGRTTYRKIGVELVEAGISLENTIEILSSLFWAAAEEYGN